MPNMPLKEGVLEGTQIVRTCTLVEFQEMSYGGLIYGVHPSEFGDVLVACLEDRLCGLLFQGDLPKDFFLLQARAHLRAELVHYSEETTRPFWETVFAQEQPPLLLAGTPFQLRVWLALLQLPKGSVMTYQQLASLIHAPRAMRSIGQALKANPVAYVLPCHRVISASGKLGGYRWGSALKRRLLAAEGNEEALLEDFS